MHEWDWDIKTCVDLKEHSFHNNLLWEIHKKAPPYSPYKLCLLEKVSIICADPDTLLNERTGLISKFTTRIVFCWLTLRNNCHAMVFNYLPQFFYKDTEQDWHILCCSFFGFFLFLLRTCESAILHDKFHGLQSQKSINNFYTRIICK